MEACHQPWIELRLISINQVCFVQNRERGGNDQDSDRSLLCGESPPILGKDCMMFTIFGQRSKDLHQIWMENSLEKGGREVF